MRRLVTTAVLAATWLAAPLPAAEPVRDGEPARRLHEVMPRNNAETKKVPGTRIHGRVVIYQVSPPYPDGSRDIVAVEASQRHAGYYVRPDNKDKREWVQTLVQWKAPRGLFQQGQTYDVTGTISEARVEYRQNVFPIVRSDRGRRFVYDLDDVQLVRLLPAE